MREMTTDKYCEYGMRGSFDNFLFLFSRLFLGLRGQNAEQERMFKILSSEKHGMPQREMYIYSTDKRHIQGFLYEFEKKARSKYSTHTVELKTLQRMKPQVVSIKRVDF